MRRNGPAQRQDGRAAGERVPRRGRVRDPELVPWQRQLLERFPAAADEAKRHTGSPRLGQHEPAREAGRAQHGDPGGVHDLILSNRLEA